MVLRAAEKKRRVAAQDAEVLLLVGDFIVTALWVVVSSLFGEAAEALHEISGLGEFALAVFVTVASLMVMGPLCDAFGGALFNPVHNAAFFLAGRGSWRLNALRVAAQVAGALGGSYLAVAATPEYLKDHFHKLPGGLKPGVELGVGVGVEALLGLALNVVVLWSGDAKSRAAAYWAPLVATVALIVAGSYYTGPSMNPAVAFSWFHHFSGHAWHEQILVYWVAPFVGAVAGGLVYRRLQAAGAVGGGGGSEGGGGARLPAAAGRPKRAAAAGKLA